MKRKLFIQKIFYFFILSIIFISFSILGQTVKPDSAQTIIKTAVAKAKSSQKNVLVIFHASWCKWCKRLEAALNDPEIKTLIDKNYIVTILDVKERGDKIQTQENPGGENLMASYGGNNAGLPFIVFLNQNGKMMANSNVMPEKQNIGYPGSKEEIAAFVKLVKRTAPHMTNKQLDEIKKYFELHAPK